MALGTAAAIGIQVMVLVLSRSETGGNTTLAFRHLALGHPFYLEKWGGIEPPYRSFAGCSTANMVTTSSLERRSITIDHEKVICNVV